MEISPNTVTPTVLVGEGRKRPPLFSKFFEKKPFSIGLFCIPFNIGLFCILFCCILGCVLPLQEVAFRQGSPAFSVLCSPCPYHSLLLHILCPLFTLSLPLPVAPHSLSFVHLVLTTPCCSTFSVLCSPCPYHSLLLHILCPLLTLSLPLPVAPHSLSFVHLVLTTPCCSTMSSIQ